MGRLVRASKVDQTLKTCDIVACAILNLMQGRKGARLQRRITVKNSSLRLRAFALNSNLNNMF